MFFPSFYNKAYSKIKEIAPPFYNGIGNSKIKQEVKKDALFLKQNIEGKYRVHLMGLDRSGRCSDIFLQIKSQLLWVSMFFPHVKPFPKRGLL